MRYNSFMTTKTTIAITLTDGHVIPAVRFPNGNLTSACFKCNGSGYIAAFGYYDDGVCFSCSGRGYKEGAKFFATEAALVEHIEKAAKRREASRKSRAKKEEAERLVRLAEWEAGAAEREAKEAAVAAEREAKLAGQSHLAGEIGERGAFSGAVKLTRSFSGNSGPSLLVVVSLDGGSEVKFFSTANFAWELNEGDEVSLTGEISGFDQYGESKQTVVKKAKVAKIS